MEKTRESLIVRTRCPRCSVPYTVDAYLIHSTQPVFHCRDCSTHFTFPWPQNFLDVEITATPYVGNNTSSQNLEQMIGASENQDLVSSEPELSIDQKLNMKQRAQETIELSKELIEIPTGPVEAAPIEEKSFTQETKDQTQHETEPAQVPGIYIESEGGFEKVLAKSKDENSEAEMSTQEEFGVPEVELKESIKDPMLLLWREIVEDWSNQKKHDQFLAKCISENQLTFASHKYAKVLSLNPVDSMALPMKKKITAIVEADMNMKSIDYEGESKVSKFKVNDYGLSWIGIGLSLVVIAFGLLQPDLKNLVGLGAAMIALIFGIRWMFRSNQELKMPMDELRKRD